MADDKQPIRIEEDNSEIMNEEDEEDMMLPSLEDFLVTEDGDNIATGLVKSLDRIARLIDTQNKIFIKMYTLLSKA